MDHQDEIDRAELIERELKLAKDGERRCGMSKTKYEDMSIEELLQAMPPWKKRKPKPHLQLLRRRLWS